MLEIIHVFVILLGEWRQYIGFMPFMFHLKIQTEYYCKSVNITMIKMCWINMKLLKCLTLLFHYPLPCQFLQEVWFGRGWWFILLPIYKISFTIREFLLATRWVFHVHICTYWRCYSIIHQIFNLNFFRV